jgi:glycosyltransferase involved in cell wall biosynthesis
MPSGEVSAEPRVRVLVCTQGFPRHPRDHHATFVLDHTRALAGAGAAVTVLCPSAPGLPGRDRFGDVEVVRFRYAPRRLELLGYGGAMHRRIRGPHALLVPAFLAGFLAAAVRHARSADVVHAHWWAPSGLVAVVAGRLLGVASVVHLHGTDAAIARGPLRLLARWTLRRAGAVLAVSRDLVAWADRVAGVTAHLAPMPVVPDRVPAPSPPPAAGPVLAVGRLVPEKGFDVLVRAAATTGVPVVLVGDGGEAARLRRLAAATAAPVSFLGPLPPEELAGQYRAARAVAVPSRREGFGLVAAEAAAAGRAVVASAVGGLPDIVADGVNGVLVPPGDVEALAAALRTLDPGLGAQGPEVVGWLRPDAIAGRSLTAYEGARANLRPAAGPRLARAAGAVLGGAAVLLCALAVVRQWDEVRALDLRWSPAPAAGAVAAVVVANLTMAWAWGWLVRRLGGGLSWRPAMRVWWTGQLGRYLPTGLGSVPARVVLGWREGVPGRVLAVATGAEPGTVVAACAAIAGLLLPGPLAAVAVPLGLATTTALLVVVVRVAVPARLPWTVAAGFTGLQAAQVLVRALGFWWLLGLAAPTGPGGGALPFATVAGAVGLAYLIGFLAVFAPGGAGVREAVLVATLAGPAGVAPAAAAAVAWRLLELAVELPSIAWARTLDRPVTASSGVNA